MCKQRRVEGATRYTTAPNPLQSFTCGLIWFGFDVSVERNNYIRFHDFIDAIQLIPARKRSFPFNLPQSVDSNDGDWKQLEKMEYILCSSSDGFPSEKNEMGSNFGVWTYGGCGIVGSRDRLVLYIFALYFRTNYENIWYIRMREQLYKQPLAPLTRHYLHWIRRFCTIFTRHRLVKGQSLLWRLWIYQVFTR